MPKKCQPGVICVENMTMMLIILVILFVIGYLYLQFTKEKLSTNRNHEEDHSHSHSGGNSHWLNPFGLSFKPNVPYSNVPGDVYMNPYTAPLRDTRYMTPTYDIRGVPPNHHVQVPHEHGHGHGHGHGHSPGIPVNVATQSIDTRYRQVGILTRMNNSQETILPLMGRPLFTSRDKWQYYSMSDKNNSVKLPLSNGGRSCTSEYGCNSLNNGDNVYIEGYNDSFKVTVYDNNPIQYIPHL